MPSQLAACRSKLETKNEEKNEDEEKRRKKVQT